MIKNRILPPIVACTTVVLIFLLGAGYAVYRSSVANKTKKTLDVESLTFKQVSDSKRVEYEKLNNEFSDTKRVMDYYINTCMPAAKQLNEPFGKNNMVNSIDKFSKLCNVTKRKFEPEPDAVRVLRTKERRKVSCKGTAYSIEVEGKYSNIGRFVARLEQCVPLLHVDALSLQPLNNAKKDQMTCSLKLFVLSEIQTEEKK